LALSESENYFLSRETLARLESASGVTRTNSSWLRTLAQVRTYQRILFRNKNNRATVLIDWELSKTPPTIGDTFGAFVLARVLARMGFRVTFAFDLSMGLRADWISLEVNNRVWLFKNWHLILRELQFAETPIEVVNLNSAIEREKNFETHDIVLQADTPLYKVVPRLLNLLWRSNRLDAVTKEAFFVDSINPSQSELKAMGLSQPYVTWNVRAAQYDLARNLTESEIIKIYKQLCESFPKSQIVILSNDSGVNRVQEVVLTSAIPKEWVTRLVAQPKDDFLAAMRLLLGSQAFVQHLGGGIGVVALYSRVPMFTSMFRPGSYPNPKGGRLMEWNQPTQKYVLIGPDREYSDDFEKWVARI
jgi:hypothetical protein